MLKRFLLIPISIILLIFLVADLQALENGNNDETTIENWLLLGPVQTQLPIWHDVSNVRNETFDLNNLLTYNPVNISGDA